MIEGKLSAIVNNNTSFKDANPLYVRSLLKEYLQYLILNFIYNSPVYQKLIFTGGTCLRLCFGLPRLSEDLDFDALVPLNVKTLAADLKTYFNSYWQYNKLTVGVVNRERQILLKLPVLKSLGLATSSESDLLYLKIDVNVVEKISGTVVKNVVSTGDFNFVAANFSLETLFAKKISAIFSRRRFWGEANDETVKGRDFFDLIWLLQKGVVPDIAFLDPELGITSKSELMGKLDAKLATVVMRFAADIRRDLLPFVRDTDFVENFYGNLETLYKQNSSYLR